MPRAATGQTDVTTRAKLGEPRHVRVVDLHGVGQVGVQPNFEQGKVHWARGCWKSRALAAAPHRPVDGR
jgi:hypothetical protein